MALALALKPIEYVAVDAKMYGCLALRHHDPRTFPEIVADGSALRRVAAGLALAPLYFLFQLAKRIFHGSILLCDVFWPSMR